MGDAPARTELNVTTGPIRGSRKIHVGDLKVAMRTVDLEPSSGEPPVILYDTSGPYTDPARRIDIMAALGLGVDVKVLANVGGRVTAAVTLSLMLLLGISIALVHWFK